MWRYLICLILASSFFFEGNESINDYVSLGQQTEAPEENSSKTTEEVAFIQLNQDIRHIRKEANDFNKAAILADFKKDFTFELTTPRHEKLYLRNRSILI